MDSLELIERAKARTRKETGSDTDYATAKALGWPRPRLSVLIRGMRRMSDTEVIEISEYTGVDPHLALVCVRAEYQEDKGSEATPYWRALAEKLEHGKTAA